MPNWEALQVVARDRYKQDLPGALARAIVTQGGQTLGNTGINGLAVRAAVTLGQQVNSTEWHELGLFNNCALLLATAPAP